MMVQLWCKSKYYCTKWMQIGCNLKIFYVPMKNEKNLEMAYPWAFSGIKNWLTSKLLTNPMVRVTGLEPARR